VAAAPLSAPLHEEDPRRVASILKLRAVPSGAGLNSGTTAEQKRGAVPSRARISGSQLVVSLNSRLESNKEEEDSRAASRTVRINPGTGHCLPPYGAAYRRALHTTRSRLRTRIRVLQGYLSLIRNTPPV